MSNPPPIPADPDELQPIVFVRNRRFEMVDFQLLFDGKAALPNFEPLPVWQVAKLATSFYGKLHEGAYAKVAPSNDKSWNRALYMLTCGQGGGFTGEGYVIVTKGYASDETSVIAGRFALCKHEMVEGPGANHSRGWHPGWCGKCGLDMSVDSGD
jgi:hypothetical protein